MPELLATPWSLLLLVVPAWLLTRRRGPPAPWSWWIDPGLAVLFGLAGGLLGALWLASFSLREASVIGSPDFLEYCWSTDLLMHSWTGSFNRNRSRLAGALPALIARDYGLFNGLLGGALVSSTVICGALYVWARSIHSRAAGATASLVAAAVPPLALFGRTMTYYPEITALLTCCMAGAALAMRVRTPAAVCVGAAAAALGALADSRGLLWWLPAVGLISVAALLGPSARRRWRGLPLRLCALVLPLWVGWWVGAWAYIPDAKPLEGHVTVYDEYHGRGFTMPPYKPASDVASAYVWGRSDLRELPHTLLHVANQGRYVPPGQRRAPQVLYAWRTHVAPWLWPVVGGLALAVVGLRRRPLLLGCLLGTCLPFVASLDGAVVIKHGHLRFLGSAMPFIPVVIGVGVGVLGAGALGRRGAPRRGRGSGWRAAVIAVTVALAVTGAVPTWISPVASWKGVVPPNDAGIKKVRALLSGTPTGRVEPNLRACASAVARFQGDGEWIDRLP